jgi:hypothetical protein
MSCSHPLAETETSNPTDANRDFQPLAGDEAIVRSVDEPISADIRTPATGPKFEHSTQQKSHSV